MLAALVAVGTVGTGAGFHVFVIEVCGIRAWRSLYVLGL